MANGLWFRLYVEVAHSRKIQNLPPELFKFWINLMCLAKANAGVLPSVEDISWTLRLDLDDASGKLEQLKARNLVDVTDFGLAMHDWDEHQFDSDSSTERVREWRKRKAVTLQKQKKKQDATLHATLLKQRVTGNETLERQSRAEQRREENMCILSQSELPPIAVKSPPNGGGKASWKKAKFEEFWSVVWAKKARGNAQPVFERHAKSPEIADQIIAAAKKQGPGIIRNAAKNGHTPVFPATWLNGQRWLDEDLPLIVDSGDMPDTDVYDKGWREERGL